MIYNHDFRGSERVQSLSTILISWIFVIQLEWNVAVCIHKSTSTLFNSHNSYLNNIVSSSSLAVTAAASFECDDA